MTAIQEDKKKIFVICPFPQGEAAGQRLKYEQYFKQWNDEGFEITVSCFMDLPLWAVVYTKGHYIQKILGVLRGYSRRFLDLFAIHTADLLFLEKRSGKNTKIKSIAH